MKKKQIKLNAKEKDQLLELIKKGSDKARKISRARILLMMNDGVKPGAIVKALGVSSGTLRNIRLRYLSEGIESALNEKPRPGAPTLFDGRIKAKITALACTDAPEGRSQWSLRLLSEKAVELNIVDSISHMDVSRILKKTKSNRT